MLSLWHHICRYRCVHPIEGLKISWRYGSLSTFMVTQPTHRNVWKIVPILENYIYIFSHPASTIWGGRLQKRNIVTLGLYQLTWQGPVPWNQVNPSCTPPALWKQRQDVVQSYGTTTLYRLSDVSKNIFTFDTRYFRRMLWLATPATKITHVVIRI